MTTLCPFCKKEIAFPLLLAAKPRCPACGEKIQLKALKLPWWGKANQRAVALLMCPLSYMICTAAANTVPTWPVGYIVGWAVLCVSMLFVGYCMDTFVYARTLRQYVEQETGGVRAAPCGGDNARRQKIACVTYTVIASVCGLSMLAGPVIFQKN